MRWYSKKYGNIVITKKSTFPYFKAYVSPYGTEEATNAWGYSAVFKRKCIRNRNKFGHNPTGFLVEDNVGLVYTGDKINPSIEGKWYPLEYRLWIDNSDNFRLSYLPSHDRSIKVDAKTALLALEYEKYSRLIMRGHYTSIKAINRARELMNPPMSKSNEDLKYEIIKKIRLLQGMLRREVNKT